MRTDSQSISVDRIFLDLHNPRHKPYASETEVISYLCANESVFTLAQDIAKIGLNPLESFALTMPEGTKRITKNTPFTVAEGNRRMCAIKLLNDPDLAPAKLRKDFTRLSASSSHSFEFVPAVIFDDRAELDIWLERIHGGPQGGIGRKSWSPEQKTRHLGDRKNALAQSILDYAEKKGHITAEERKGKITTAQRYLGNSLLKEAMGLDSDNSAVNVSRTRPAEDFDVLIKTFVQDLMDGTVHSRANSDEIKSYSRKLSATEGVTNNRVAPVSVNTTQSSKRGKQAPKQPKKPKALSYEPEIEQGLKRLRSYKLQNLYFSICDIALDKHTPLISVGVWSFLESLTARCGRDPGTPFPSFLSHNFLMNLGVTDKDQRKTLIQVIQRISEVGNTTKHNDTAANFNGMQLANDMDTLKNLIVDLTKTATP